MDEKDDFPVMYTAKAAGIHNIIKSPSSIGASK